MSTIETERLVLRPFRESDAADVLEYLRHPTPNCFVGMKLDSLDEARAEMVKRSADAEYCFAITLKESGKVIGEIDAEPSTYEPPGLRSKEAAPLPPPDTYSPCWMLNVAYQGKGYAYEAAHAFFDYLFTRKGVRRIFAYTEDYNVRSQHLCEKLGMRLEGMFLEFVSFVRDAGGNPVYENTMQYAILKREWMDLNSKP
ncbi:MAG: GNAT family N-acetyltransferase [Lentisphaeria bacterium]|nr:GNAT family N-acetyltransferase [Lentisphaeria bacterium]